MEKKRIRYGLIGCGDIAYQEIPSIKATDNSEVVMVMDVKKEFAEAVSKEYNVPFTTDMKELLAREDIDAVIVAVPHFLHTGIAAEVVKAGKHIVMEKPISVNLKETDKMIEECKKHKVKLSVPYNNRYIPEVTKAKELVQKGAIGKVINITALNMTYKPESYWKQGWGNKVSTDWRASLEKSGGGIFMMNLIHTVDWLYLITGLEVERVYAEYGTFSTNVEVEDMISVTLRYKNGAVGCYEASSTAFGKGDNVVRIYGNEGQIVMGNPLKVYVAKPVEGLKPNQWNEIKLEQMKDMSIDSRAVFMRLFSEALLEDKEVPVTAEDGRRSLEVVRAAYISGKTHKPVTLPVKE